LRSGRSLERLWIAKLHGNDCARSDHERAVCVQAYRARKRGPRGDERLAERGRNESPGRRVGGVRERARGFAATVQWRQSRKAIGESGRKRRRFGGVKSAAPRNDMKSAQWRLLRRPMGRLDTSIFELAERDVGRPNDGQVLVRTLYLGCDASMIGSIQ